VPAARRERSGYAGAVSRAEWQEILDRLAPACASAGLDLLHPFPVASYNSRAAETERLPDVGRADALGLLVGNTRKLWPAFASAHASDEELRRSPHPLDAYVRQRLELLLARATSRSLAVVYAHVTEPAAFPIQRLAEAVGFSALSPSHLAIHPDHGPWFSLRAVAVIGVAGPQTMPVAPRLCSDCAAPCVPALQRALELSGPELDSTTIAARAGAWIAVRDACPLGKASRYGEDQLAYHYTKERSRIRPAS
jgi:hypothetical protein